MFLNLGWALESVGNFLSVLRSGLHPEVLVQWILSGTQA